MTRPAEDPGNRRGGERGSVTPLVLGMVACLLILGAGVIAAGSAFVVGQRVQNVCDGAAAAAGDALDPAAPDLPGSAEAAALAAQRYLAVRGEQVGVAVTIDGATARLTCTADPAITFGEIFGHPTLRRTVTAASTPKYTF